MLGQKQNPIESYGAKRRNSLFLSDYSYKIKSS